MILAEVTDKDTENFVDRLWDFAMTIFNSAVSAVEATPHKLLGFVVVFLIFVWLWKKISG